MKFTNTKILLSNYPRIQQEMILESVGSKDTLEVLCGYDYKLDNHQITLQIANDIITAILTYDKVYIEGTNIWSVLQVFGQNYIKELLKCDILHFVPDNTLSPVMIRSNNRWSPNFISYTSGCFNEKHEIVFKPIQEEWGEIETKFYRKGLPPKEAQALLYLIDDKKAVIDQKTITDLALKETLNDLKNKPFAETNNILRIDGSGRTEFHQLNILRLHELNTVAVTAELLGVNAIKTDSHISNLMNQKCASAFANKLQDGVAGIQSILHKKGFPDLGELFVKNVINLDDILKLRNSIGGNIFRYWAMTNDYDEEQMQKDIMNSIHTVLGSKLSSILRFTTCSVIGFVCAIPGIATSAFDSFVLNKVAKGWHPNIFLDDKIKCAIDKCIQENERKEKQKLLLERFKNVRRNEPCPCGSGLKFKKCHGKNL